MERTETQQAERAPASTTGQAAAANDCSCNCDYGCDCDCDYGCGCCCGCERAPTGLSIYQQARRMLRPDGEQMESLPRHPLESSWRAEEHENSSTSSAGRVGSLLPYMTQCGTSSLFMKRLPIYGGSHIERGTNYVTPCGAIRS